MSNPAQRDTHGSPPRASLPDSVAGEASIASDSPLLPIEDAIAEDLGDGQGREFVGELVDVRDELYDLLDPDE